MIKSASTYGTITNGVRRGKALGPGLVDEAGRGLKEEAEDAVGEAGMVEWAGGQLVKERAPVGMPGFAVPILFPSGPYPSDAHLTEHLPCLSGHGEPWQA